MHTESLSLTPAQERHLEESVVCGLAIILQALTATYFTRELAGKSQGLLNIITEKMKTDATHMLFAYWRRMFHADPDSATNIGDFSRILELEIGRAIAEEYGELNETERIDITVELLPYVCHHNGQDNYQQPTLVILVRGTYLDRNSLPDEHSPLSNQEVAAAGWHTIAAAESSIVIDDRVAQTDEFRAIGLAVLTHALRVGAASPLTYNFQVTQRLIAQAVQRSQLPDYKNESVFSPVE